MTVLTYRRLSASPPPVREQLVLGGDGVLLAWRSNGPTVGRFLGDASDARRIRSLAEAALPDPTPAGGSVAPDAQFEILDIGDRRAVVGADGELPGPWGALLTACRELIERPGEPLAAVALLVETPGRIRLEHRGPEPLELGLGALAVSVVGFRADAEAGSATTRIPGGKVEAGPGWSLVIEPEPVNVAGGRLVVSASFNAFDEGIWAPVRCEVVWPD